jgi:hypothetical protein
MILSPEQREQLRLSLLRFLDANNTRFGLATKLLAQMCRSEGLPLLEPQHVETELRYLEEKSFVQEALKGMSPENRCWRITAAGRDFRAQITGE